MSEGVHKILADVDDKAVPHVVPEDLLEREWLFKRHCGYRVEISVRRWYNKVSKEQRGYYWAVVLPEILEAMGEDNTKQNRDEMHDTMKAKFSTEVHVGKDDQILDRIKSPSIDSKKMTEFIDKVIRWANQFLGIEITPPQKATLIGGGGI